MKNHRFILEPYKGRNSRHICPNCGDKAKTFTFYIDIESNEPIAANVGRCSREIKCSYHYTPREYFLEHQDRFPKEKREWSLKQKMEPLSEPLQLPSFIPVQHFKDSLRCYSENNFVQFLLSQFGATTTTKLIEDYFIGTSKYWNGATVFWQIDIEGNVHTGKIMQYSQTTGKRIKKPYNHIQWVHKVLQCTDFNLNQCLFGEHLLSNNTKPVAIVESEKTAIIASAFMPYFIWLATGSLNNLSADKCTVLKGHKVILFPDLNAFDKWSAKAKELAYITSFIVSDLLERNASDTEKRKGLDIADYLLKG